MFSNFIQQLGQYIRTNKEKNSDTGFTFFRNVDFSKRQITIAERLKTKLEFFVAAPSYNDHDYHEWKTEGLTILRKHLADSFAEINLRCSVILADTLGWELLNRINWQTMTGITVDNIKFLENLTEVKAKTPTATAYSIACEKQFISTSLGILIVEEYNRVHRQLCHRETPKQIELVEFPEKHRITVGSPGST